MLNPAETAHAFCENSVCQTEGFLNKIDDLNESLLNHFKKIILVDKKLTRQLVSFQANKKRSNYRWYKYKEAFSADLVEYFLKRYNVHEGKVLDPFAGAGTTLFVSSELGYSADGIELLPVGQQIINSRKICQLELKRNELEDLKRWRDVKPWNLSEGREKINTLRITNGAYHKETEEKIEKFLYEINKEKDLTRAILKFALLCILESVSYTRKDGQYLRWDYRSGRRQGQNTFDKGKIFSFDDAITQKIDEIIIDLYENNQSLDLFSEETSHRGDVKLLKGSCLDILPKLESDQYKAIITSPPYCNRYDYTRTYALEHAILGIGESELIDLRQQMLSCTVENREKELLKINSKWKQAIHACENNQLLQNIIQYLEYKKENKELNNNGIPRMVKGYFYEMACVIQDCLRVLETNGLLIMVNDNVRYAGACISVDLILSKIAEDLGFEVSNILVLPQGKGNSSQQMGLHGRDALRKSVYVWRKKDCFPAIKTI